MGFEEGRVGAHDIILKLNTWAYPMQKKREKAHTHTHIYVSNLKAIPLIYATAKILFCLKSQFYSFY